MNNTKRAEMFKRLEADNPHPTTELVFSSPFELLAAVLLSAQATDISVNLATAKLFRAANTPEAMAQLGIAGIEEHIRTIGLYHAKARHLLKTCEILSSEHGGEVPNDRAALEALPGVGRKTANVVLNTAFGVPTIAVDTHIFRVSNRTGLAKGKTPLDVEKRLLRMVPAQYQLNAHHWIILHGRYICKARKPLCWQCQIADLCDYRSKTAAPPEPRSPGQFIPPDREDS